MTSPLDFIVNVNRDCDARPWRKVKIEIVSLSGFTITSARMFAFGNLDKRLARRIQRLKAQAFILVNNCHDPRPPGPMPSEAK